MTDKHIGMELAWGLIANAYRGDWDSAPPDWKKAAERWRDEHWHPLLAEHPADDDEPVTEDWLLSVGHHHRVSEDSTRWTPNSVRLGPTVFSIETDMGYGVDIPVKTRGDVRHLCAGLGIELKCAPLA